MTAATVPAPQACANDAEVLAELQAIRARLDVLQLQVVRATPLQAQLDGFSSATRDWLRRVMGLVVEEFCVPITDLTGVTRHPAYVRPRFVLVWLLRHSTEYSCLQISRLVNRTDHSTVIHALRRVDGWRDADAEFRRLTDALLEDARALREQLQTNHHAELFGTQPEATQTQGAIA